MGRSVEFALVDNLMREWGLWMRQDSDYSKLSIARGGSGRAALINDKEALQICYELAFLKKWQPEFHDAVDAYYRRGMSQVDMAKKFGWHRGKSALCLQAGAVFVARGILGEHVQRAVVQV